MRQNRPHTIKIAYFLIEKIMDFPKIATDSLALKCFHDAVKAFNCAQWDQLFRILLRCGIHNPVLHDLAWPILILHDLCENQKVWDAWKGYSSGYFSPANGTEWGSIISLASIWMLCFAGWEKRATFDGWVWSILSASHMQMTLHPWVQLMQDCRKC